MKKPMDNRERALRVITADDLESFLRLIADDYEVHVPVELPDGTRTIGTLGHGPLSLRGGAVPRKPTWVFFAQYDRVFRAEDNLHIKPAPAPEKPIFVLGFSAADVACLKFIDKFFAVPFEDEIYTGRRKTAVVAALSGCCGKNGDFLRIAGRDCDMEFIADGNELLVACYSEAGERLGARMGGSLRAVDWKSLLKRGEAQAAGEWDSVKRASEILLKGEVPEEFWREIADRCIACMGCNYVCPTCTCFDVCDWKGEQEVERWRLWDSCLLEGFQREGSGHSPMKEEWSRTRRRIHHKLAADVVRWGHMTCFFCGRCDAICPTGIGIRNVSSEIVKRFG